MAGQQAARVLAARGAAGPRAGHQRSPPRHGRARRDSVLLGAQQRVASPAWLAPVLAPATGGGGGGAVAVPMSHRSPTAMLKRRRPRLPGQPCRSGCRPRRTSAPSSCAWPPQASRPRRRVSPRTTFRRGAASSATASSSRWSTNTTSGSPTRNTSSTRTLRKMPTPAVRTRHCRPMRALRGKTPTSCRACWCGHPSRWSTCTGAGCGTVSSNRHAAPPRACR